MCNTGKLIRLSVLAALGAVLLTWLLNGESSPFADYFSSHVGLRNAWETLNALPFIAAAVISANHGGGPPVLFTILQFGQWVVVTFVLSSVFCRMFKNWDR